jgi:hypothetical protein
MLSSGSNLWLYVYNLSLEILAQLNILGTAEISGCTSSNLVPCANYDHCCRTFYPLGSEDLYSHLNF